jgi:ATP-binding cassette, subfamily F, member 3
VADRLWLTADGSIKPFAGDIDDYARFVLERARAGAVPAQQMNDRGAANSAHAGSADFDAAAAARLAAKKAAKRRRRRGL